MLIVFRKGARERDGERNIDVREKHLSVFSHMLTNRILTRDGTCNLVMWPDQESNPRPFGKQNDSLTN